MVHHFTLWFENAIQILDNNVDYSSNIYICSCSIMMIYPLFKSLITYNRLLGLQLLGWLFRWKPIKLTLTFINQRTIIHVDYSFIHFFLLQTTNTMWIDSYSTSINILKNHQLLFFKEERNICKKNL